MDSARAASTRLGLALPIAFTPTIPYVLYPVLADGFLTLVVGSAALASLAALSLDVSQQERPLLASLALIPALYVLVLSYPFLLIPGVLVWVTSLGPVTLGSWRRSRLSTLSLGLLALLMTGYLGRWAYPMFSSSAALFGSVIARDEGLVLVALVASLIAFLVGSGKLSLTVSAIGSGTLATAFLIERVPGNEIPGYSYYATKVIIGGAAVVTVLLPALVLSVVAPRLVNSLGSRKYRSNRAAVAMASLLIGLLPIALARSIDRTPSIQRLVWTGWSVPSPISISTALGSWGQEPTAFFRYSENESGWLTAEDRLMNFWMPAFWSGYEGAYTQLWTWVYFVHASPDPSIACEAVRGGITKIITRDSQLRRDIQAICPDLGSSVSIEVRV
jgi:hypothetical protein